MLTCCLPAGLVSRDVPVVGTNDHDHDPTASQSFSGSIPDDDPLEGAVTDPNILAEVKLPTRPSMLPSLFGLSYTHLLKTRIQMDSRKSR
jgi:hypothetical protein